jgi:hypothetical protein
MLTYAAIAPPEVVHGKGRVLARLGWVGVIGKGRVRREKNLSWQDRGAGEITPGGQIGQGRREGVRDPGSPLSIRRESVGFGT